MKKAIVLILLCASISCIAQPNVQWDSVKATVSPVVAPALVNDFETPFKQPLSAYGWEDGIHISRDGLNLYALYYPGDLYSWTVFFLNNYATLPICDVLGTTEYIRPYADTYGMDMVTNGLGCDNFINIDILYAERANVNDPFLQWQLSGIARPGAPEGGPYPLQSQTVPGHLDIFIFTATSDIWMIRNTTNNPTGIASAVRLPSPVNPVTDEFSADNPHLERLAGDTLLLVYEKYTDLGQRDFVYSYSYDNGDTWTFPVAMTTVSPTLGHIEHPHLYKNPQGEWYMYFSIDCEIYRAKQSIAGNWDSWQNIELVIGKGNSPCIGEPSLTENGDISFAVAYANYANNDTTDTFDIDPWFLPRKPTQSVEQYSQHQLYVYPNPASEKLQIVTSDENYEIRIFDVFGRLVFHGQNLQNIDVSGFIQGVYMIQVNERTVKFIKN